jgi:C1A family cysteine protease
MIFYSNFTENNKDNSYVLGVNAKDMTPKYLTFTGYDRVFGSHYDQYVINYDTFVPGKPDSGVFKVSNPEKCTGFPGPGDSPMAESLFFEILGADEPYSRGSQTRHIDTAFDSFRDRYNKKYITDKEEMKRRQNFLHNYRFVKSRNSMGLKYTLSLNHLSDLSETEIKRMRGYRNTGINSKFTYMSTVSDIPVYMNWWLRGAVTPVKDQGICGSCWSFGTTGTLEGSNFIKTGKLVALSEQAFVDCSWGQGNNGCDGGESERAYEWLLLGKCLPTERSYRYLMDDSTCHDKQADCGVKISAYYNVMSGNVTDLKAKIYERGPISIAIDASHRSFSFYANGVYYEPKCGNTPDSLDHQVLAVGYGVLNGDEYVLVKNSWSTHWGFDGFVLMSTRDNNCGIATDASFADIA